MTNNSIAKAGSERIFSRKFKNVHRGSVLNHQVAGQMPDFTTGNAFQLKHTIRDKFLTDDDEVRAVAIHPILTLPHHLHLSNFCSSLRSSLRSPRKARRRTSSRLHPETASLP
jgi:hypothetical protein